MSETSDKTEKDEQRDGAAEDAPAGDDPEAAAGEGDAPDKPAAGAEREGDDADVVAAPVAPAEPIARPSYVFLAVVTLVTLAADLGTKLWAEARFPDPRLGKRLEVVEDFLIFRHVRNKGGAWGILGGESPTLRISFFIAISIVAVVFILSLYRRTSREQKALTWGLPLVLGGALGNLVDRIRYGEVVDFIEVHLGSYQHPTFNIADVAIVAGVGLMAIDMFTPRKGGAAPAKSERVPEKKAAAS